MKKLILLLTMLSITITFNAQDLKKKYDQFLNAQTSVHDFSGAVLISKNGKIVYQSAFGLANREWRIANSTDTRFPIGSLTKQFTAAAILQLQENGKLSVGDKLSKYFPDYPKGDQVTLHMLLNHTSGIKECSENPHWFAISPNLPIAQLKDTIIKTFKFEPYDFEPGTHWKYSNSGYILLGYIIEQASGETYLNYIEKQVLQPAGMTQSGILSQDTIVPEIASGYSKNNTQWKKAAFQPTNVSFSAGILYATVGDLFNWRQALNAGKILGKKSLELMNTPNLPDKGAGYGVFIDRNFNHKVIQHQGALSGFNTYLAEYPEDGIGVIVLTNRDTNLDFIPKGLAAIAFGNDVIPAYKRQRTTIAPEMAQKYAGNYTADGLPFPINITEKNGKLFLQLYREIELVPESDNKFYIDEPDVEIQFEFVRNASNKIKKVYFIEAGVKTEITKLP